MTVDQAAKRAAVWGILLPAAAIMMLTMGARQVSGLFVSPINTATGLGIVSISFALAIGQFVWGATQPIFGAAADRYGPVPVVVAGGLLLAIGTAITPFMRTDWGLIFSLGILVAAGAGAGSFSILISAAAQRLPPERRSFGAGFVNAGGSFGQFVFAPVTERLIALAGWVNAMFVLAALSLLTLPLALKLRTRRKVEQAAAVAGAGGSGGGRCGGCRRHRARNDAAPASAHRRQGSQLPAAQRRLLHLRLPHRVPGHPPARGDRALRPSQQRLGHLDRVARIESGVMRLAGLQLAGNAYRGVGIAQCIHSGESAAARLAGE